jgi:hypothetical protein
MKFFVVEVIMRLLVKKNYEVKMSLNIITKNIIKTYDKGGINSNKIL